MNKLNLVGIDVSAKTLEVAINESGKHDPKPTKTFENTVAGHSELIKAITRKGAWTRVGLEATGSYSLGIALALDDHPRAEVMVANPRAVKYFAQANMQRNKNDPVDSRMVLEFVKRMPFKPWRRPSDEALILRGICRRLRQLSEEIVKEKNRRHGKEYEMEFGEIVSNDIKDSIRDLARRSEKMEEKALEVIMASEELSVKYRLLLSVKGIAQTSGIQILGELAVLPPEMKPPQWVAVAGLDVREEKSGTSVNKPKHISKRGNKYLRASLYMPAMVGSIHDPHIAAFYGKLLSRNKHKMQAQVAVMRKLLHAIWGMFKYNQPFDGEKFHPLPREGGE